MEREFRSISISPKDEITVKFDGLIFTAGEEGNEEGADDNENRRMYSVRSNEAFHKELKENLLKLKKFVLGLCEVEIGTEELRTWSVSELTVTGSIDMKKSRAQFKLAKLVRRTKKIVSLGPVPQFTMYPIDEEKPLAPADTDKITTLIEQTVEEIWDYIDGVHSEQLALFPKWEEVTA